jgi:opacity protein-like surface antigen
MKKLMIVSFVLALLMSAVSAAQYGAQQPDNSKSSMSMKSVNITGTISDDGKTFVNDKDGKSWAISNPDAVKGHEGHHVILLAQVDADKNAVHIVSLKMAKDSMTK